MIFQNLNSQNAKKPAQQPSISITPLPRNTAATANPVAPAKPGDTTSKNTFVICEICDGYIKDLEQLRNHMQWIHKIKIHPKMIYNRWGNFVTFYLCLYTLLALYCLFCGLFIISIPLQVSWHFWETTSWRCLAH